MCVSLLIEINKLLRGTTVIKMKPCPVQLSIKVVEQDKIKMAESLRLRGGTNLIKNHSVENVEDTDNLLNPGDSVSSASSEGEWITFDKPMFYV